MSWIKVIATKTIKDPKCIDTFTRYINKLSKTASNAPGFIKSQSYWENGSSLTLVSISDWTSQANWDQWLTSIERKCMSEDNRQYIQKEEFQILIKKRKPKDIFLL